MAFFGMSCRSSSVHFMAATGFCCGLLTVGCSTFKNTLAQDLAWERWKSCDKFATVRLKEIRPDGQIWVWYGPDYSADRAEVLGCLAQAAAEQSQRKMAVVPAPEPVATTATPTGSPRDVAGTSLALPVWKPRMEWAYRWESPRGAGTFVWSVDRTEALEGVEYYVVKSGTRREVYYRKSDLAYYMDKVDGEIEYRLVPMSHTVPWPLAVGKEWEIKAAEEWPKERQTRQIILTCKAEAEETTVVPAGEFKTLKIGCRDSRTGTTRYEVWYAPQVKHWVRERRVFDYGIRERELIEFRVE